MKLLLVGTGLMLALMPRPSSGQDYESEQNFTEKVEAAREFLARDPKNARANLRMGAALTGHLDYAAALPYLQQVLATTRDRHVLVPACINLMVAHFALGQTGPARQYYQQALQLEPDEKYADRLHKWGFTLGLDAYFDSWYVVERPNIIYHFQDTAAVCDLDAYMTRRDSAYATVARFFRPDLSKKIDFFLWQSTDTAQVLLGRPAGFTRSVVTVCHNRNGQSPGHELTHALVFWTSQTHNLTKFINEGLAVCFSKDGREKLSQARWAWAGKGTPDVRDLWLFGRKIPDEQLYPLAGAFVYYLLQYSPELLRQLAADQLYLSAASLYGDAKLDALIREFTRQLTE